MVNFDRKNKFDLISKVSYVREKHLVCIFRFRFSWPCNVYVNHDIDFAQVNPGMKTHYKLIDVMLPDDVSVSCPLLEL